MPTITDIRVEGGNALDLSTVPANAMGPARNSPYFPGESFIIQVSPEHRLRLMFSFNAAFENSIILYRASDFEEAVHRDNRGRGNADWLTEYNNSRHPEAFIVTGWNRRPGQNEWNYSKGKILSETSDYIQIGFEDATDGDYNDAVIIAKVIR